MKKQLVAVLMLLPFTLLAQNNEGTIEFEEVVKFKIDLPPEMMKYAKDFPTEDKTNMTLSFNAKESLYKISDHTSEVPKTENNEQGLDIEVEKVVIGGGGSTITYIDLEQGTGVRSEDMMGKMFLVSLGKNELKWSVKDEQRDILGYTCLKATAEEEGETVTAWFTPQIPISSGPSGYRGLAGMILAVEIPNEDGGVTIAATSVDLIKLKKELQAPKKGQKVSSSEFDEIVAARMKEMREMSGHDGDGNVVIKIEQDIR